MALLAGLLLAGLLLATFLATSAPCSQYEGLRQGETSVERQCRFCWVALPPDETQS